MWNFLKKYNCLTDNESLYDKYLKIEKDILKNDEKVYISIGGFLDQVSRLVANELGYYNNDLFTNYISYNSINSIKDYVLKSGVNEGELNKLYDFYKRVRGDIAHGKKSELHSIQYAISILSLVYKYTKCILKTAFNDLSINENFDWNYYSDLIDKYQNEFDVEKMKQQIEDKEKKLKEFNDDIARKSSLLSEDREIIISQEHQIIRLKEELEKYKSNGEINIQKIEDEIKKEEKGVRIYNYVIKEYEDFKKRNIKIKLSSSQALYGFAGYEVKKFEEELRSISVIKNPEDQILKYINIAIEMGSVTVMMNILLAYLFLRIGAISYSISTLRETLDFANKDGESYEFRTIIKSKLRIIAESILKYEKENDIIYIHNMIKHFLIYTDYKDLSISENILIAEVDKSIESAKIINENVLK